MATQYLIRFDDITPGMAWTKFQPFEDLARELRLPYLLGVVPDCRDVKLMVEPSRPDFWSWVRRMKGQGATIAQHGYMHLYETDHRGMLGLGRKSEFAGLPYDVQYERLARGKDILQGEGVWDGVFMAPSHSFDQATLRALRELGFRAITDGFGFFPYEIDGLKVVPQLFARPFGFGIGVETVCIHANTLSDERRAMLIAKLRTLHAQIVSFDDALRVRPDSQRVAEALRIITRFGLNGMRAVRSIG
jgi:predicted deacetylase